MIICKIETERSMPRATLSAGTEAGRFERRWPLKRPGSVPADAVQRLRCG
jgi:hypothetical protein